MTPVGLYFHVPFCAVKCPYCDFYSVSFRSDAAQDFTAAAIRSIAAYPQGLPVDTLYFGGGTPSLLPLRCLEQLISTTATRFSLQDPEITLEVNPNTAIEQRLADWRALGINRLSIGVQSCTDVELSALGRRHTAEQAISVVTRAARLFSNLSCDVMLGIPGQTSERLAQTLTQLTALPITHISAYLLSIEPGTPFDCDTIRAQVADEETMVARYLQMREMLERNGFLQYEISNFAKPGFKSRHNLKYWQCINYIGIGPGAHSCFGGRRYAVPPDLAAFCNAEMQPEQETDSTCYGAEERVMLGLRLTDGIRLDDFTDSNSAHLRQRAVPLLSAGYLQTDGMRLWLTPMGMLVSNRVIGWLTDGITEDT